MLPALKDGDFPLRPFRSYKLKHIPNHFALVVFVIARIKPRAAPALDIKPHPNPFDFVVANRAFLCR